MSLPAAIFDNAQVLVTGGCGFIGSHLVEALVAQGARVTALDNLQSGQWSSLQAVAGNVRMVEGDVRDADLLQRLVAEVRPHCVFHLAANASVPASVADPAYDFEANCQGTFNLLDALRLTGGCLKIVFASSGAVYGNPKAYPIREEDPISPISPYGTSKASAELLARMFQQVYGLPVVIARIFNTYGPRMARFVILDFLRKLHDDPFVLEVLGNGSQIRDFTYVSDVVAALVLLSQSGTDGEAYNISSGTSHSVTDLANKMIAALGLKGKTEIFYTGRSWVGDAQRWEVSIAKIAEIGYEPRVMLEEGLQHTIQWFLVENGIPLAATHSRVETPSYENAR